MFYNSLLITKFNNENSIFRCNLDVIFKLTNIVNLSEFFKVLKNQ